MKRSHTVNRRFSSHIHTASSHGRSHFKAVLFLILVLAASACFLVIKPSGCRVSAAETASGGDTRYSMYVVQAGDTLWDIADSRLTEEFPTCREYAREVMRANCMEDSKIYPGDLLMIPEEIAADPAPITIAGNP